MTFHLMHAHIFYSGLVAEWLPFRKKLFTRLTTCLLGIFNHLSFWFCGLYFGSDHFLQYSLLSSCDPDRNVPGKNENFI